MFLQFIDFSDYYDKYNNNNNNNNNSNGYNYRYGANGTALITRQQNLGGVCNNKSYNDVTAIRCLDYFIILCSDN